MASMHRWGRPDARTQSPTCIGRDHRRAQAPVRGCLSAATERAQRGSGKRDGRHRRTSPFADDGLTLSGVSPRSQAGSLRLGQKTARFRDGLVARMVLLLIGGRKADFGLLSHPHAKRASSLHELL